jgi:hypothetical protein
VCELKATLLYNTVSDSINGLFRMRVKPSFLKGL